METAARRSCPTKYMQRANCKQSVTKPQKYSLPKGLVGSKCTAVVSISGINVNCLLDSGSQVTTVTESFYKQNFPDQNLNPLYDLLEVEGAAGQPVPYLGYIETCITFPKDFLDAEIDIPTLALVVPDTHPNSQTPVLVGTTRLMSFMKIFWTLRLLTTYLVLAGLEPC